MIDVLCIDPGITTGYAMGQITDEGLMKVATGQARWEEKALWDVLLKQAPDILIYERFEARGTIQGVELFSRNLIGAMNLYSQVYDCEVFAQMPQDAIGGYWSNDVLRKHRLYKTTTGGHANDACRHLLHWFTFKSGYQYNKKGFEPA